MDDAALSRRCDEVCTCLERDLLELGVKNITQKQIDALRLQRQEFEELPSDEELLAEQESSKLARDAARDALELALSQVGGCAADQWGYDSPQYDRFGIKGMDAMDDATLLRAAHRAHRAGSLLLTALADQGLTADMVGDIPKKAELFRTALDGFDDAINERALAARTRILSHNSLFAALSGPVKRAQRFYKPHNATKFSHYVIYDDAAATPDSAPPVTPGS
jgi:hypothetical protein